MKKIFLVFLMFFAWSFSTAKAEIPYDHIVVENVTVDLGIDEGLSFAKRLKEDKTQGNLLIMTDELPRIKAYASALRGRNFTLVCNEGHKREAQWLKDTYPDAKIYIMPMVHGKILLMEPETVWIGSPDFGSYGYVECAAGLKNKKAYDYYYNKIQEIIRIKCKELKPSKKAKKKVTA